MYPQGSIQEKENEITFRKAKKNLILSQKQL